MHGRKVGRRTGREAGLQLLGLLGVLDREGVEEALAPDLELGLVGLLVALDHRSCKKYRVSTHALLQPNLFLPRSIHSICRFQISIVLVRVGEP